jgi:RNA recognition motif-containing protein
MHNIYIGNLSATTTEHALRILFQPFGEILSVTIATDRDSKGPRGFAFVEMENEEEAKRAIAAINGSMLDEHQLEVNEARDKQNRGTSINSNMRRHRQHPY